MSNNEANFRNSIVPFNKNLVMQNDADIPTVNGAIDVIPISFALPKRAAVMVGESSQPNRKKQKKSFCIETSDAKLKLWRNEVDEYILEIHELTKNITKYHKLKPCVVKDKQLKDKQRIIAKKVLLENEGVLTKVRDAEIKPLSNKYKLSLTQRLEGPWVMQKNQRGEKNINTDVVYKHPKVKNLRSLNELCTYIMYAETY